MFSRKKLAIACIAAFSVTGLAHADDSAALKAQLAALQKQIDALKAQMEKVEQSNNAMQKQVQTASGPAIKPKPGSSLTFDVGGGQVTLYGHADVSVDSMDNGLSGRAGAVGSMGTLSQVSSNLSYFGVRGSLPLTDKLTGVFQFETEVVYSSISGTSGDNQVKGGLGSRNSFVGIQGGFGAVKLGKTDAPYKTSTSRMDPFSASVGDYNSIIGNSGGDNRAEFDTRVTHAVWYESPTVNGFHLGVLVSPGQNRSTDNSIRAQGEANCTGGNLPPCGDGSFGNGLTPVAGPVDNAANLLSLGYKHHFDKKTSVYFVAAEQKNHPGAHYDLGASGHGVVVDCHHAAGNCFSGATLRAISAGVTYDF